MRLYDLDEFVNDFSNKLPAELVNDFDVIRTHIEHCEMALDKACLRLERISCCYGKSDNVDDRMNKHQEALDEIYSLALPCQEETYKHRSEYLRERYDLLKRLIDKETPMKVENIDLYIDDYENYGGDCPKCGYPVNEKREPNYCGECGQAIDWSDEE